MFSRAEAYQRFMGRWSRLLAPRLVTFAQARADETVLDVGSGTGALALALRDAVKGGRVTGVDPSTDYVRHAAESCRDPLVSFEVGDAQQLTFSDGVFDKALSALVINFIPDPARALREMARVTKSGGIVSAAVWDYAEGMQMLRVFWDEAIALDPENGARDEANMPLCRKGELAALWSREGLAEVEEASLTVPLHFESFDDYWAPFLLGQGPAGAYVASMQPDRRSVLEQRLRARLVGDDRDGAIDMVARAWAVKGSVPVR